MDFHFQMTVIKQNAKQLHFQVKSPNDELPVSYFVTTTLSHLLEIVLNFNSLYGTYKIFCVL